MNAEQFSLFGEPEPESTPEPQGPINLARESLLDAMAQAAELPAIDGAEQDGMFDRDEFALSWREWQNMPQFSNVDLQPWRSVIVHFASREDLEAFEQLVDQKLRGGGKTTASCWYPKLDVRTFMDKRYVDVDADPNQIPKLPPAGA